MGFGAAVIRRPREGPVGLIPSSCSNVSDLNQQVAALCLDTGHLAAYARDLSLQCCCVHGQVPHHAMLHAQLCLHLYKLPLQQLHLSLQGPVVILQLVHLQARGSIQLTTCRALSDSHLSLQHGHQWSAKD